MAEGKIARKMPKGYGFISRDGEEDDVFFHATDLVGADFDALSEGDDVTFDLEEGEKGLNAVNVQLA